MTISPDPVFFVPNRFFKNMDGFRRHRYSDRMGCCSHRCKQWTTMSFAVVFLILGILIAAGWSSLFGSIIYKQLSVANTHTKGYDKWKETAVPMYLEFYMFNWTNPEETQLYGIKPRFQQLGPYVFYEHHIRENVTFNDNDTLTYYNRRIWRFEPNMTVGSLQDNITTLNPIATSVANIVQTEHYLVRRAVNFFFIEEGVKLTVTKTVNEFLFEGYNDTLLTIAKKLNVSGLDFPFKSFGWFVDRNNSVEYDGTFNMYTGENDISKLGVITKWNNQHHTPYYPGECGIVNGTSGELWYPPRGAEVVSMFIPDLCSNMRFHRTGTGEIMGISGDKYSALADVVDNGTYYPEQACFASGVPTGARTVSKCKFNAPAYISYPHFYLADPYYLEHVDGMNPNATRHTTFIYLEPRTGFPMKVQASLQLNLLMPNVTGIDIFANVKTTMMPMLWFTQKASLTDDLASLAKLILALWSDVLYVGYAFIVIGAGLTGLFGYITWRGRWRTKEEEELLTNQTTSG